MAAMFDWLSTDALRFASDATLVALIAVGLLIIAMLATLAEQRRNKRKHIDRVGWMPWTTIAVANFFGGMALLMLALKSWLAP